MTDAYPTDAEVVQICRDLFRIDPSNYGFAGRRPAWTGRPRRWWSR